MARPRKYAIRTYLGRYESWLLQLYGRRAFYFADRCLERFFSHFPTHKCLSEFCETDFADYEVVRKRSGVMHSRVQMEISAVAKFWRWLREDQKLNIPDALIQPPKQNRLTLEGIRRLFDLCEDERLLAYMQGALRGQTVDVRMHPVAITYALTKLGSKAGLPWLTLPTFREAVRNLICVSSEDHVIGHVPTNPLCERHLP